MNIESDELFENYMKACDILDFIQYLIRHHVPFEQWPPEIQGLAGINQELMGKNE
jgi:hypothetical protein